MYQFNSRIDGNRDEIVYGLAVDTNNNIIYGGSTTSSDQVIFQPSQATIDVSASLGNGGDGDAFVVKISNTGAFQWVARMRSSSSDWALGVKTDSQNNIYVAGQFSTAPFQIFDANNRAVLTVNSVGGGSDGFLVKYTSNGSLAWAMTFATPNGDA